MAPEAPVPLPPLPEPVRAALPAEVQAYLAALEQRDASREARLGEALVRIAELEARLARDSRTSSRPPSSDPPWKTRAPQPPTGRKPGGQPGHQGSSRLVLGAEAVDEVVEHWPRFCPRCRTALRDAEGVGPAQRQQVWDLPETRAVVTEHRLQQVRCPGCRKMVRAERPPDGAVGACGPRLTALVGLLHGRYRVAAREVQALLAGVWGVELSVGSLAALWQRTGAALEGAQAEARSALEHASVANLDETSWRRGAAKRWLWAATCAEVSVFRVAPSRAAAELGPLLGAEFGGVVGSDRYRAYDTLPVERRGVCWAHLKRDVAGYAQYGGAVGAWGQAALVEEHALFARWHRFRRGELTRAALQAEAAPIQARVRMLLEQGLEQGPTRGFCREVLRLWPALWTFLEHEGVEPTNNAAERALRPAVLWRKGSFGTQSDSGDRFAERILTVAATCRQQGRDLLEYLTAAVSAHATGAPAPALLPAH